MKGKNEGEPQLRDSPYVLAARAGFEPATFGLWDPLVHQEGRARRSLPRNGDGEQDGGAIPRLCAPLLPPKHAPQANDGGARRNKSENTMIGVMSGFMSCLRLLNQVTCPPQIDPSRVNAFSPIRVRNGLKGREKKADTKRRLRPKM